MSETRRLLEAATALSHTLTAASIPHAFHGSLLVAVLANLPTCNEILCIVEGGNTHPFRRVRQAVTGHESLTATNSPWTNRLHVTYHRVTPPINVEILPAGEEGPRRLDGSTVTTIRGLPFLTISEFVRAKIKARGLEHDAQDIVFALGRYWQLIDINRILDQDMDKFVLRYPAAAQAWAAIKNRYGAR
ncbi:hypothetical protein BD410DRAFT_866125 [Rickenella mellea]|uniref:Uncharacterized protein n=1 Tax=Rickenella mellea TaxID=50990 RepID=A0A4Y7Q409_9AGAM|nr:hypothetical protein BD410DRAFT_866125 [Rickenella mellea]